MNFLAGWLIHGEDHELEIVSNELRFSACVWHGSDWSGLVDWLRRKGAKAGYTSDEMVYPDYFGLITIS